MRTSLVNRYQMENIAQLESASNYSKTTLLECFTRALFIGYLCLCYYLPPMGEWERNPNCKMNCGYANAMFAIFVVGPALLLRILFLIGYLCKKHGENVLRLTEYVEKGSLIVSICDVFLIMFGCTAFFWYTQSMWQDYPHPDPNAYTADMINVCTTGRNLVDFANW